MAKDSVELDLPKSKENGRATREKLCKKLFGTKKHSSIQLTKWVNKSIKVMQKAIRS